MKKPDPARTHISSVLLLDPENKDAKALLVSVEALEKKQRDDEERKQREDAERVNMRKDLLLQLRMLGFRLGTLPCHMCLAVWCLLCALDSGAGRAFEE